MAIYVSLYYLYILYIRLFIFLLYDIFDIFKYDIFDTLNMTFLTHFLCKYDIFDIFKSITKKLKTKINTAVAFLIFYTLYDNI